MVGLLNADAAVGAVGRGDRPCPPKLSVRLGAATIESELAAARSAAEASGKPAVRFQEFSLVGTAGELVARPAGRRESGLRPSSDEMRRDRFTSDALDRRGARKLHHHLQLVSEMLQHAADAAGAAERQPVQNWAADGDCAGS